MQFDIENLDSLRSLLEGSGRIEKNEKCSLEIMAGGVSNKTVLFSRESGEQWVIKQALTKLRVQQDWFCSPERLQIEYKGMQWLSKVLPAGSVPRPVFFDADNNVLAMEAVARPHENLKSLLLQGEIPFERIEDLGRLLANIHDAGRSAEAGSLFSDRSFFIDLRINAYYKAAASRLPETDRLFQDLINDTLAIRHTVVHGDFSPKNILVKDERIILLDHEVMHTGDPCFDIGFCLAHLLSKANYLEHQRGLLIRAAHLFWESYVSWVYKDFTGSQAPKVPGSLRAPGTSVALETPGARGTLRGFELPRASEIPGASGNLETPGTPGTFGTCGTFRASETPGAPETPRVPENPGPSVALQSESRAVRHTIGCLLSRVEGRSPLEYLDEKCRKRQVKVVLGLMRENILTIPEFIDAFGKRLYDKNIV